MVYLLRVCVAPNRNRAELMFLRETLPTAIGSDRSLRTHA